jgi:hypothetical protein
MSRLRVLSYEMVAVIVGTHVAVVIAQRYRPQSDSNRTQLRLVDPRREENLESECRNYGNLNGDIGREKVSTPFQTTNK